MYDHINFWLNSMSLNYLNLHQSFVRLNTLPLAQNLEPGAHSQSNMGPIPD